MRSRPPPPRYRLILCCRHQSIPHIFTWRRPWVHGKHDDAKFIVESLAANITAADSSGPVSSSQSQPTASCVVTRVAAVDTLVPH